MPATGMPSFALIWAHGAGGFSVSVVISRWQLRGQVQERLAKRRAALGRQQVMLGGPGLLIGDGLRMRHRPGSAGA